MWVFVTVAFKDQEVAAKYRNHFWSKNVSGFREDNMLRTVYNKSTQNTETK